MDPKKISRICVVSRQALIDSKFSTVICAPVYTNYSELSTQVAVGPKEGLKHNSCIYCDELISIPKTVLTDYIGTLSFEKIQREMILKQQLNKALSIILGLDDVKITELSSTPTSGEQISINFSLDQDYKKVSM